MLSSRKKVENQQTFFIFKLTKSGEDGFFEHIDYFQKRLNKRFF